jgi:Holliday junction resolvasome RuvABC endonuclease subunit
MLVVPEIFRSFNFLGVDPGSMECGVSIYNIRDYKIASVEALTLVTDKVCLRPSLSDEYHSDRQLRLEKLCLAFRQILETHMPVLVACESPFFNPSRPGAFGSLTEVMTLLRMTTIGFSPVVRFVVFAPQEVKQTFKRSGQKGKIVMKEALAENQDLMSKLIVPFELLDEHSVDAIAVGYTWWINQLNGSHS